ncbi:MAG: hypothetical protein CBC13_02905 [Planctomycetia bacterium TMED53]|nr:MAG: hypothetical protein CBC13_02905 [Planctomycetia bacterium TMED53]
MDHQDFIKRFRSTSIDRFESRQRIRSFSNFLDDFLANPYPYLRNSPRYILDVFEHYGTEDVHRVGITDRRWKIFDLDHSDLSENLVGQERVQNSIYMKLRQFARNGKGDRLLLLHGPNGSAKSTTINAIMEAMHQYSILPEGALYRFNWIFPEKSSEAGRIGFEEGEQESTGTYAFLNASEVGAIIRCELKDSPLLLIPRKERRELVEFALSKHPDLANKENFNYDWVFEFDLSQKSKWIYEALLGAHKGDWLEVMRHVQVERFFHSKKYRLGCISIEPQGNIDAQVRPIGFNGDALPTILHGLPLYEVDGDLIAANRGLCEYSDFLKRPPETNKYLLTTSEKGTIQLPNFRAHLDLVLSGSANEKQLNMFKRTPDFSSFKGRLALVRVPYLLQYSREAVLYTRQIDKHASGGSVAPHTAEMAALWVVLTRLKRPSPKNHSPELAPIVARLTPIQKALLYDHGETPMGMKEDERKLLVQNVRNLREEHEGTEGEFEGIYGSEYEGRRGASPREMLSLIAASSENEQWLSLSPLSILEELESFIKDSSVHDFLRLAVDNGYHDCRQFISDVRNHYLELVRREVFDCLSFVEEGEFDRLFGAYFQHVKSHEIGESLYSDSLNEYVKPSEDFMNDIEKKLSIKDNAKEFRSSLLSRIGAYVTENPSNAIDYSQVFPEVYNDLKQNFWESRKGEIQLALLNILRYFTEEESSLSEQEVASVKETLNALALRYGYDENSSRDVVGFIVSQQR